MSIKIRIGQGFDVHRFGDGNHVWLGGVRIDCDQSLVAHSDGDVLLHAICDALLGALALGDIGKHFPDTDERYAGIDSAELLRQVYALVAERGFELVNLDATVIAQKPRMAPHIDAIRQRLSALLDTDQAAISVKATTTEGLGFTGRNEGIAAQAVVLLTATAR